MALKDRILSREYQLAKERLLNAHITLTLTGRVNVVKCSACKNHLEIKHKDEFTVMSIMLDAGTKNARTKRLKNNREAYKWFVNFHWLNCIENLMQGE